MIGSVENLIKVEAQWNVNDDMSLKHYTLEFIKVEAQWNVNSPMQIPTWDTPY